MKKWLTILLGGLLLAGCAATGPKSATEPHPRDPWEPFNRQVFAFNRTVDTLLWRPLAKTYDQFVPVVIQHGVSNFFINLSYPIDIINLVLQGEPADAGKALGRFVVNSTLGVLGVLDIASRMDIPKYEEDFGQTLAVWGWEDSPYLVLPFLGGATITQTVGYAPDYYFNVVWRSIDASEVRYGLAAFNVIQLRAQLLTQEETIQSAFDPYILFRDSYFQRRQYLINNGESELPDYESLLPSGSK